MQRKPQIVLDYFIKKGETHPRLSWIMRKFPDTVIVTDREHCPYYAENKYERYISADAWNMGANELIEFMQREGPDRYSYSTPSAFAMSLWRNWFYPGRGYILPADGFRFKMCRSALYGGRCEVYQYGPGFYYQYDINSSYPYASTTLEYPDPHSVAYVKVPDVRYIDTHEGVSTVVFSQGGPIPPLPVHAWDRVIYPEADRLTGTYTHTELRYAMGVGVEIHAVLKQYIAHKMLDVNPFTDYVQYCYERRGDGKIWKRIANVLFGRLSVQQNSLYRFRVAGSREELAAAPRYLKNFFGANMVAKEFSPPPEGNALWSALVLSQARIRLHHYAQYAVYLDTDCIFSPSTIAVPVSEQLGEWKCTPGEYDIRGAKAYRMQREGGEDTIRLKGIPTATRTLDDFLRTRATQERIRLPDGSTKPYSLSPSDLMRGLHNVLQP